MKRIIPLVLVITLLLSFTSCSNSGHDLDGIYKSVDGSYTLVCRSDGTCAIRHKDGDTEYAYTGTYDKEGNSYALTIDKGLGINEVYKAKKIKGGIYVSGSGFSMSFKKQ